MAGDNVEVVRRWWERFNADGTAPVDLCDEELVMTNPPEFPVVGPFVGHAGVRQWATEIWEVFDDLRMEVEEVVDAGDGENVVGVQRVVGRMRHTGLPIDVEWAAVTTIRDGKVVRAQGFMTREEAFAAAGLAP